jgi:hypothetical protein
VFNSRQRQEIRHPERPRGPAQTHPPNVSNVFCPTAKKPAVNWTANLSLMRYLRMNGIIPLIPLYACIMSLALNLKWIIKMTAVSVSIHCGKPVNRLCSWHHCIRVVMQCAKCDAAIHFISKIKCFMVAVKTQQKCISFIVATRVGLIRPF